MNLFNTKIKKLRTAKEMKRDKLAKVIGVSKETVSVWERNVRFPEMRTIHCLVDYFRVPLSFLLDKSSRSAIQSRVDNIIRNNDSILATNQSH